MKRGRIVLALGRLFLIPAVVLAVTPLLSAQTTPPAPPKKPPELKLEIVPAKKIYLVGEVVVVKYKLTNPTDKTVCFPRPDTKTEEETEGYIRTIATNHKGESDNFIEGFYPRVKSDQELLDDANVNWIKLAPGLSYVTEEVRPLASLAAGDWKLQSRYSPPYLRGRATLIADALSCTPPQVGVVSKRMDVTVITNSGGQ